MLPRGAAGGRGVGIVLGMIALGLGASQVPRVGSWMADGLFLVLAAVTVVSAVGAVTFRSPVYCAIWFGQALLGTAALMFLTGAQFLAVATVVVYAGAILVTFLFVLMLAQPEGRTGYDCTSWEALVSAVTGVLIVGVLSMTIGGALARSSPALRPPPEQALTEDVLDSQHVVRLGQDMFGHRLLAVELAGALLLVAVVGAAAIVTHKTTD